MSSDVLREQLHHAPFQPVTLFLPSGKTITISNLELAMLSETGRTLIVAQGEKFIFVDVATAEAMETAADWKGAAKRPDAAQSHCAIAANALR